MNSGTGSTGGGASALLSSFEEADSVCDNPEMCGESTCFSRWDEDRQARMLARQREEILRHKWIESEKAQRDLGSEAALDWIKRYAAQWRKWYEEEYEPKRVGRVG